MVQVEEKIQTDVSRELLEPARPPPDVIIMVALFGCIVELPVVMALVVLVTLLL